MSIDRTTRSTRAIIAAVGAACIAGLASSASAQCDTYTRAAQATAYVGATNNIGSACDDCTTLVTFPFTVSMYGTAYSSAFASSNGNLQFGATGGASYTNTCLPSTTTLGNPTIFPHWDDQRTDTGGGIFTETVGTSPNRQFIIEWRTTYFGSGASLNYEVVFYEGQTYFDIVYGTIPETGGSATAGVQFQSTGPNTQQSCNTAGGITDGTAFRYTCASLVPGACCAPDGTCSTVLQTGCASPSTFLGGVCTPNPCPQPPANDECTGAIVVSPGSSTSGTNNLASGTDITTCAFGDTDDVWFTFTTTTAGFYQIDTEGTVGLDTTLALFGTCPTGTELACDDDGGTDLLSLINVNLTAATQYWIRVAGYNGANGNFQLNVGNAVAPPAPPANDTCATATVISSLPFSDTTTEIAGATDDADLASCNAAAATVTPQGVWYRYTPTVSQRVRFLENSVYNTFLSVFTSDAGCGGTFTEVPGACGFNELVDVTAGTTYYVLIGSAATAGLPPPVVLNFTVTEVPPITNDTCATATVVSGTLSGSVDNSTAINENDEPAGSCNAAGAVGLDNSIWFTFTPGASGPLAGTIDAPIFYDIVAVLYTGSCGAAGLTEVACYDSEPIDLSIDENGAPVNVNAGTQYFLAIGDWGVTDGGGGTDFTITVPGGGPVNGACCIGTTCTTGTAASCVGANTFFAGAGTVCNPAINSTAPCCKADFNHVGGVTVQDIFDFLNAYFSGGAPADINGGGVSVQDIFDFLSAYFAGCP